MTRSTEASSTPDEADAAERKRVNQLIHPRYRADIDGLRALAVLPVVLYHTGVRGFSGGFVGVDIFFVISGYLITAILVREIGVGGHTIAEFYRRRILRIFPALFFMLAVVAVVACATLMPFELGRFERSLIASACFGSNIEFYLETDYFDLASASKPLLHTWSLAVEEQWYLIWPVLLALIGPRRPKTLILTISGLTIVSFALGVYLIQVDAAAAFYLLPGRAWELGVGAFLAVWKAPPTPRWLRELLAVLGLAMVAFCIKRFTYNTLFPGWAALPVCLGAGLLIFTGSAGTLVSRVLSLPPLTFIGGMSYSLYLWHWPVIVFAKLALLLPDTPLTSLVEIATAFAFAFFSWRFVERYFRVGRERWSTRGVLGVGVIAIASAAVVAFAIPAASRVAAPFTPEQNRIAGYMDFDGDAAYRRGSCFMVGPRGSFDAARCLHVAAGRSSLLLSGDSHAADLWPGLSRVAGQLDVLQATASGCVPKIYQAPYKAPCQKLNSYVLGPWLRSHLPAVLILSSRWTWRTLPGLADTLRNPQIRAAHPILIGPMPEYNAALPRVLVVAERRNDPGLVGRSLTNDPFLIDAETRKIAASTGTPYVSLIDLLCHGRACVTRAGDAPLLFDTNHLTLQGSTMVAGLLTAKICSLRSADGAPAAPALCKGPQITNSAGGDEIRLK